MSQHFQDLETLAKRNCLNDSTNAALMSHSISRLFLIMTIVVVPLMMAWAKEWGIFVLFLSSAGLALNGAIRSLRSGSLESRSIVPLVLAAAPCMLVLMQLVPLPPAILDFVSTFQQQTFSDWPALSSKLGTPNRWATLSLTPHLTESSLALAACYFMLIVGLWFFLKSPQQTKWLLSLIAVSVVLMSCIALLQLLFRTEKFLWLFENPMRSANGPAKGTFTNQNHFAGFLSLGVGACLYQCLAGVLRSGNHDRSRSRKSRSSSQDSSVKAFGKLENESGGLSNTQKLWAAATVVVLFTSILSFSRGGTAAMFFAFTMACFGFRSKLPVLFRFLLPASAFCVVGVLVFGSDVLAQRWNQLVTSSSLSDVSGARVALWESILEAAPSFILAGSGAGSHAEVYPVWMAEDFGKRFSHAENGYLQVLLEMGGFGILLIFLTLVLVTRRTMKALRVADSGTRALLLVSASGIFASFMHSLADFVWYIPGYLVVLLALLMILFRSTELLDEAGTSERCGIRPAFFSWAVIGLVIAIVTTGSSRVIADARSESYWLQFRALAMQSKDAGEIDPTSKDTVDDMIRSLESCLRIDPSDSRALSDLSILYLQRFEKNQSLSDNPMSVAEIRNTVNSVGFEDRSEMLRWLAKAFGEPVGDLFRSLIAARSSINGQPLRATPYLVLHQLSFLLTDGEDLRGQLMDQAIKVRPHEAAVRYAAAIADVEAGRLEDGLPKFGFAFRKDKRLRKPILAQLMDLLPIQDVVAALEPDSEGLLEIFQVCQQKADPSQTTWVAQRFRAKFAEADHPSAFGYWSASSRVFNYLREFRTEVICLKQALIYRPQTYSTRRTLAFRLVEIGESDEAVTALKACLLRKPDDSAVKNRLEELASVKRKFTSGLTN